MTFKKQIATKPLLLFSVLAMSQITHANLLVNGSFEQGSFNPPNQGTQSIPVGATTINGWTVVGDVLAWIGSPNPWSLAAAEGSKFLDLTDYSAGAPFGGVTQAITTVAGQTYELSFDLGSSTLWGRPSAIQASAAGVTKKFTSASTGGVSDWDHVSMSFTAVSSSTTISLQGVTGNDYIGLDNASVDAVSTPPPVANTNAIVNIQGFGDGISTGSGADIGSYPVAPGTIVTLQNPVLVDFAAGDYVLTDAWGQTGALFDTWNFQSTVPGSWGSHYVVATPDIAGKYKILLDVTTNTEPTCKNHFCAWDTREQATAAFLATPAKTLHLDSTTTLAFAAADYYLPDNLGGMSIRVAASAANQPPVANAGADASGLVGTAISLEGGASADPEGSALTYAWLQTSGPSVSLNADKTKNPVFTPVTDGVYSFSLIVNDGQLNSVADTVSITVSTSLPQPIPVNPGIDRAAAIGDSVKLQANAVSSKLAKNLKYRWHQSAGPQVWKKDKKTKNTVFTPLLPGTYSFSLIVSDNTNSSNAGVVTITVNPSLTLTSPDATAVWQAGRNQGITWSRTGINPRVKLVVLGSVDGGITRFYINKSVPAGKAAYRFKVKPSWKTNNAFVAVCLMHPTLKNTPLTCGQTQGFVIY